MKRDDEDCEDNDNDNDDDADVVEGGTEPVEGGAQRGSNVLVRFMTMLKLRKTMRMVKIMMMMMMMMMMMKETQNKLEETPREAPKFILQLLTGLGMWQTMWFSPNDGR